METTTKKHGGGQAKTLPSTSRTRRTSGDRQQQQDTEKEPQRSVPEVNIERASPQQQKPTTKTGGTPVGTKKKGPAQQQQKPSSAASQQKTSSSGIPPLPQSLPQMPTWLFLAIFVGAVAVLWGMQAAHSLPAFLDLASKASIVPPPRTTLFPDRVREIVGKHFTSDEVRVRVSRSLIPALSQDCEKPSVIFFLGDSRNINHTCHELAYAKGLPITYLEGNAAPDMFLSTIGKKLQTTGPKGRCPSQVFVVNTNYLTEENRDRLEVAFDDSQPILRYGEQEFATMDCIFFLISEVPPGLDAVTDQEKKADLRKIKSREWTGRFYQRIGTVIIGK